MEMEMAKKKNDDLDPETLALIQWCTEVEPFLVAGGATLTQALQTNIFGINSGLIAQLQAQYAEYWAQNTGALTNYAGASAAGVAQAEPDGITRC